MRSGLPPLLPIFRSRHQADLLTWLFLHPDREYTITDLATRLDVPLTTLHRESQRLAAADLIRGRTVGRSRLLQANLAHPVTGPLTHLLTITFGPQTVVEDEFAAVPGVERVLIYGSWAARYQGEHGPAPADLDVLVLGTPDRSAVYDAADRVQERIGLPVNPVIRTPQQWAASADPLLEQIRASPAVTVLGPRTAGE